MIRKGTLAKCIGCGLVIAFAACQPVVAPTPSPASDSATLPLVGTEWLLNEMQSQQLIHDATVTAQFSDDGTLAGRAGCNDYTTVYSSEDGDLTIDPNFNAGENVCDEAIMAVESIYLASLQDVGSFEIVGNVLFLRDQDGTATLVYQASAD